MAARLQVWIVAMLVGLIGASLAALWVGWGGWMPLLLMAAALGLHAIVLAAEYALMRWVNRRAGVANDSWPQAIRAWWGEALAAPQVFCWRQPFFSRRWPDRLEGQGRGVLLIHGYLCNRGLWNHWLQRLQQRSVPVVALTLEPPWADISSHVDAIENAVAALHAATGQAPVLVAHSMGGLAARSWRAAQPGNAARLHHLLTLGTPHHGTFIARAGLGAATRQMRWHSDWLQQLQALEAAHEAAHDAAHDAAQDSAQDLATPRTPTTCFYSHSDNIVFPSPSATLAGARAHRLVGVAHVHLVERDEPWQALLALLDGPR